MGATKVERWELCGLACRRGWARWVGAGWLIDFPPHWIDAEPIPAYLLNFYVDPAFRGRGLAYDLLKTAVEDARRRGIRVVSLHASKFGKPLYERNGFEATNEMILRLDDSQDR